MEANDLKLILDAIAGVRSDLDNYKKQFEQKFVTTAENLETHERKISQIEQQWKYQDKLNREKNIIIFGIKEEEKSRNELENICLELLNKTLKIDTSIFEVDNLYRKGNKGQGKTRPILMKFTSRRKVIDILSNKKYLKETNIVISEDFPKEIIEERKQLIPLMKEFRKEGKHAIIKYDRLYVDGKLIEDATVKLMNQEKNDKKRQLSVEKEELKISTEATRSNIDILNTEKQETKRLKPTQKPSNRDTDHRTPNSNTKIFEYMHRARSNSYDERPINPQTKQT